MKTIQRQPPSRSPSSWLLRQSMPRSTAMAVTAGRYVLGRRAGRPEAASQDRAGHHDGGRWQVLFIPSKIVIKKDEEIRFILRDSGELDHEFVLATSAETPWHGESMKKNPNMEHDDPNAMVLAPKQTGDLL